MWGHNFKKGDVVVLEVINGGDALKVGIVKMFLVKGGNVYFAMLSASMCQGKLSLVFL